MSDDTMGVKRTKTSPPMFHIDVEMFRDAIQWLCKVLRSEGCNPVRATLDPYTDKWHFYDEAGEHIYTAPHDLIDHIWLLKTGHIYDPS